MWKPCYISLLLLAALARGQEQYLREVTNPTGPTQVNFQGSLLNHAGGISPLPHQSSPAQPISGNNGGASLPITNGNAVIGSQFPQPLPQTTVVQPQQPQPISQFVQQEQPVITQQHLTLPPGVQQFIDVNGQTVLFNSPPQSQLVETHSVVQEVQTGVLPVEHHVQVAQPAVQVFQQNPAVHHVVEQSPAVVHTAQVPVAVQEHHPQVIVEHHQPHLYQVHHQPLSVASPATNVITHEPVAHVPHAPVSVVHQPVQYLQQVAAPASVVHAAPPTVSVVHPLQYVHQVASPAVVHAAPPPVLVKKAVVAPLVHAVPPPVVLHKTVVAPAVVSAPAPVLLKKAVVAPAAVIKKTVIPASLTVVHQPVLEKLLLQQSHIFNVKHGSLPIIVQDLCTTDKTKRNFRACIFKKPSPTTASLQAQTTTFKPLNIDEDDLHHIDEFHAHHTDFSGGSPVVVPAPDASTVQPEAAETKETTNSRRKKKVEAESEKEFKLA